jgi:hypothetical protein
VILYRKKIIDGRHRLKALKELGIKMIKCTNLRNNLSLEEVESMIRTTEKRRHQTKAQRTVLAWRDYKANGGSQQDYATKHGISQSDIGKCKLIEAMLGTKVLDDLYINRKIRLSDGKYHDKIHSIWNFAKKLKEEDERKQAIKMDINLTAEQKEVLDKLDTITLVLKNSINSLDEANQAWFKIHIKNKINEAIFDIEESKDNINKDVKSKH